MAAFFIDFFFPEKFQKIPESFTYHYIQHMESSNQNAASGISQDWKNSSGESSRRARDRDTDVDTSGNREGF